MPSPLIKESFCGYSTLEDMISDACKQLNKPKEELMAIWKDCHNDACELVEAGHLHKNTSMNYVITNFKKQTGYKNKAMPFVETYNIIKKKLSEGYDINAETIPLDQRPEKKVITKDEYMQLTPISLIFGRFEPPTLGHFELYKAALNNADGNPIVVAVIRGMKSAMHKDENGIPKSPFSIEAQEKVFKTWDMFESKSIKGGERALNPIQVFYNGYIPKLMYTLAIKGYRVANLTWFTNNVEKNTYLENINTEYPLFVKEFKGSTSDSKSDKSENSTL